MLLMLVTMMELVMRRRLMRRFSVVGDADHQGGVSE